MRLTLRTLLAYLDDTLEPEQAGMIGEKVAESEAAQELMARIKQVTRRRRLTTPPAAGPGGKMDPNTIAEYLDNALPPEQVAEVEELCLNSDVHLAEVAASHQILTLVLGEPVLVPPTARQRMYRLNKGRESNPHQKVRIAGAGQGIRDGSDGAEEGFLGRLVVSERGGWLRWIVPVAAAGLLISAGLALWMVMVSNLPSAAHRRGADRPPGAARLDGVDQIAQADGKQSTGKEDKSGDSSGKSSSNQVVPDGSKAAEGAKADDASAKGDTTAAAKKAATATEKVDKSKKSEKGAVGNADSTKDRPSTAQPPRTERRALGKAALTGTVPVVLLQQMAEGGNWMRIKPQTQVFATDHLLSLPGYRCDLKVDRGVGLILWGNLPQFSLLPVLESAVILYHNPDFDLDFKLERGRVVLSNHKDSGPVKIRVRFGPEEWDITLLQKDSEAALELSGECLPYSVGGGEPVNFVRLYGLRGQVGLKVRYETFAQVQCPFTVDWNSSKGPDLPPRTIPQAPDWWRQKTLPRHPAAQGMEAALEGLAKRTITKDAIDVVIGEVLRDADVAGRVLAVRCLGAMREFNKLLQALSDEKRPDVRLVAAEEFRHLLGLEPGADAQISQALRLKNYNEAQVGICLHLLHDFTPDERSLPGTRATLAEYLMSEKLPIRQLAHLLLITIQPEGASIPYNPTGDSSQRERGYEDWKKLLAGQKPSARPREGKDGKKER